MLSTWLFIWLIRGLSDFSNVQFLLLSPHFKLFQESLVQVTFKCSDDALPSLEWKSCINLWNSSTQICHFFPHLWLYTWSNLCNCIPKALNIYQNEIILCTGADIFFLIYYISKYFIPFSSFYDFGNGHSLVLCVLLLHFIIMCVWFACLKLLNYKSNGHICSSCVFPSWLLKLWISSLELRFFVLLCSSI